MSDYRPLTDEENEIHKKQLLQLHDEEQFQQSKIDEIDLLIGESPQSAPYGGTLKLAYDRQLKEKRLKKRDHAEAITNLRVSIGILEEQRRYGIKNKPANNDNTEFLKED